MPATQPSLDVQRNLYRIMGRIKELAPWDWMEETDVFGVQHPDTGQMGFVSVMGMAGEHFAVAVYLGAEGLYGFWDLQDTGLIVAPQQVMEIPELQASFEDRDYLQPEDRAIIKQLGLKYRGANAWPMFRSFHPGFFPWFLEADEADLLLMALEQLLDVAPRVKDKRRLLREKKGDRPYFPYMLMTAEAGSGAIVGIELLQPIPSLESMWGRVPDVVVKQLLASGSVPKEVRMRSPLLHGLLSLLADEIELKLVLADDLPAIDEALDSFQKFLGFDPFG